MLRIGIFRGAFSPIHRGQVYAAKEFMKQMWIDVLFVVPERISDTSVRNIDRLRMCELAFEGEEGIIVSDIELRGQNGLVDTLSALSDSDRRLFLLCGTDTLLELGGRDDAGKIFELAYPVYVRRENDAILDEKVVARVTDYRQRYGKNVVKIDVPAMPVSSREIRSKISVGEDASALLPERVSEYIKEKGLYRI